jgi:hypothetical protein
VYAWVGTIAVLVAIVVAIVLISSGGGEGGGGTGGQNAAENTHKKNGAAPPKKESGNAGKSSKKTARSVKLQIEPTAEVWTCVLNAKGNPLVDGQTLSPGETVGPFHSRSFTAAFGNGSVHVLVDGKVAKTPDTPSPMGLRVDTHGKVHELPEGSRPSCE